MNFLKNLFGGNGSSRPETDGRGQYFYVKPHRCDDVLRVRVDMSNDLSLNDTNSGYWVRKMVSSGNYKCAQVELTLHFDTNRRLQDSEIQGGQLVTREDYDLWQAAQEAS
ncbi:MAG: hypothetical protein K8L99_20410 [Anaerolineae bacterium]|nr:hypothetical protein [Anaerolineae bacterium]